ncbi:DUF4139 domain-containing protein [Pacificibacter marinus]|uniref:DUF4139 domain-containing protein n=1 Tax=Pacificibacter marinus TaxID=658057 RepID=UPI001C0761B4|nr:DUF4139 domain-containing protein [Pacificibacter marinus]MBU2866122.1 DUF4139 domain-containing protein [Pacificibacter marinus]
MTPKSISKIFALTAATALVPSVALADLFKARSVVSEATIYVQGANVTRAATVTLPAGQHQITLLDIPVDFGTLEADSLQTRVSAGVLGQVSVAKETLEERDILARLSGLPEYTAYLEIKDKLTIAKQDVEAIELEVTAAGDALLFINGLKAPESATAADVAEFSRMVQAQSLEARLAAQDAKVRAQAASEAVQDFELDLKAAEAELTKFAPLTGDRLRVTFDLTLATAGEVDISLSYFTTDASWAPAYKADLDTVENTLNLERSLVVLQNTDEPWIDVDLNVSTDMPFQDVAPSELREYIRRIMDPMQPRAVQKMDMQAEMAVSEPMMSAAPVFAEDVAMVQTYGLSQTYAYPRPVTLLSSDAAHTELAMDAIALTPDLTVRAVPLYNDAGYLVGDLINDSGEALLQGPAKLFRDGVYIGTHNLQTVVDGAEFEMPFGRIDGVKIARVVLDRNEGDRGFISKSNETSSSVRLDVENLTTRAWPIEVLDRVSVSEQDDLVIDWSASPMPTQQGVDDRRGVLSWRFDLPAGEIKSITVDENLRWPEGKTLH